MSADQNAQMIARAGLADKIADNPKAVLTDNERLAICARVDLYWRGLVPRRVTERVCPGDENLSAHVVVK